MELILEQVSAQQATPAVPNSKAFQEAGGLIGPRRIAAWPMHS